MIKDILKFLYVRLSCYVKYFNQELREWRVCRLPWFVWIYGRFHNVIAPSYICDTSEERFYDFITIPRDKLIFDD